MRQRFFRYMMVALCLCLTMAACRPSVKNSGINWQPHLSEKGSNPYDARIAWEALPYYFPHAAIRSLNKDFRYSHMGAAMWAENEDSTSLLILTGLDFFVGEQEWEALKAYIRDGNEVFLFCSRLDELIENDLNLRKYISTEQEPLTNYYTGKENLKLLRLKNRSGEFGYQGRSLEGFFQLNEQTKDPDTTEYFFGKPEVLGTRMRDVQLPNLVRYPLGNGHLTLHAAPLVLSNYFLLQQGNRAYLDGLMHTLPPNINKVYWQSYHRRQREGNEMSVLWRHPATRYAILLAIATLLLYVLFEMKRRQRIIPEIPQPENTSVQFAATIGQLYYHQGNHRNLGIKMWQHFQAWLRHTHNLEAPPVPDEQFARRLQGRTRQSESAVNALMYQLHILHDEKHYFGEAELRQLYQLLQTFYGHQRPSQSEP